MKKKKNAMLDFMSGYQNMEAKNTLENTRPSMREYKLINYKDVNEMSNIYNLRKNINFVRILHITI